MYGQTKTQPIFSERLQASVGELVERAVAAAPGAERSRLLQWLVAALAVFVVWRVGRGMKKMFWAVFGIAMAMWWSGGAWFLFR